MVFLGPIWIAAAVLAVAGIGKIARPTAARPALRQLRLADGIAVVRAIGVIEAAVGVAAFAFGGRLCVALLAGSYVVLALSAERLRRLARTPGHVAAGCGCFGRSSAPVGATHVALNAAAASVALGALWRVTPSGPAVWPRLPAAGVGHAVLVAAGAAAVIALMTVLPETRMAAQRQPARDPRIHLFGPTIGRKPAMAAPGSVQEGRS